MQELANKNTSIPDGVMPIDVCIFHHIFDHAGKCVVTNRDFSIPPELEESTALIKCLHLGVPVNQINYTIRQSKCHGSCKYLV